MVHDLVRLPLDLVDQLIGMRVRPFDGSLRADEAVALASHVACVDRRHPETADRAIVVMRQHIGVVLERGTRLDEGLAVAQQLFDLHVRQDDFRQVVDVRTDIAEHEGRARGLRIRAPPPAPRTRTGVIARVEAVGVLQVDHADVAEHALLDHRGHLVNQRVASEAVGDADDETLLAGQLLDLLAFGDGEEERLLADHVETRPRGRLS